jgi:acetoin utilization deacetylase AcuC-like enzyme
MATNRLAVFYDERVLGHDTGAGFFETRPSALLPVAEIHPENADRIRNIHGVLVNGPLESIIDWCDASLVSDEQLERFHQREYLDLVESMAAGGEWWPTSTTRFTAASLVPARVSAGLAVAAAEHVWAGRSRIAYALCRPPGHHAQPTTADGYCFYNNIGVAVEELRAQGLTRAAVIDWDVHHGNGTQEGFYTDGDVLTISLHMDHGAWGPTHQQTGRSEEIGVDDGIGANLNLALPYGAGDVTYLRVFDELVGPAVRAWEPEIIFIAAGQDANQFDPNGRQNVTMAGFHALGTRAKALADDLCGGQMVVVQEGGYALSYTAYCAYATLAGLLGRDLELDDPIAFLPDHAPGLDDLIDSLRAK